MLRAVLRSPKPLGRGWGRQRSLATTRVTATHTSQIIPRTGAQELDGPLPLIINGTEIVTEVTFPVISPLTGKEVWRSSSASIQNANDAAEAAAAAFSAWSKTKPSERRDIFLRAADGIDRKRDELKYIINQEIGADSGYGDFMLALSTEGLRDTAGKIADAITGQIPVAIHDGVRAMVHKRPYGVVLGIAPWNAPYHLGLRSIIFPLAAGNTTILKGSELSPRCYRALYDIFREAGLPDGCINLLHHRPADAGPVTEALIANPHIKKINFTGSSPVGAIIASTAGKHMKPVVMELGGKASAILLPDADLDIAALEVAKGAFLNSGQICMSTERILVHSSIAKQFRPRLQEKLKLVFGDQTSKGMPLITSTSANKNRALFANAVAKGANVFLGEDGSKPTAEVDTYIKPTVLTNVNSDMDLFNKESFGPSVSLYTYDTEAEAIDLANNTEYGLSAAVFGKDLRNALRVAEALESGAAHINTMTVHDEFALPHGGVKKSGYGRFNGTEGIREFLYTKTITWVE